MQRTQIAFYSKFIKSYLNTIKYQLELLDQMALDDAFDEVIRCNAQKAVLEIQQTSENAYKDSLELWLKLNKENKNG